MVFYGDAVVYFVFFFFFSSRRRHTRLQGDWSSDVCSSDLRAPATRPESGTPPVTTPVPAPRTTTNPPAQGAASCALSSVPMPAAVGAYPHARGATHRSEERRVGKECRSRGSRDARRTKVQI